ncbi:hypothetical protein EYZ11_013465 [Aspergillus tanneri]|nr:hypothetical protein EYZ11_013465 [Aspergillus tanneri]
MVSEASFLATNAINALKDILSGKLERADNKHLETAAIENWGVKFQSGLFGRQKKLVVSSGAERLKEALVNYESVFNKLSSNKVDGDKLACGDTFLKWVVTYGDMGMTPPEKLLGETWVEKNGGKASDYPGFYWNKAWNILLGDQGVTTKDGKPGGHLCQDTASMGMTFNKYKLIMICDRAWVKESLMDLASGRQQIPAGESIDLVNSVGGTFLHEMMHWLNKGIIDEVVDNSGKQTVAYGYDNCAYMAAQSKYQAKTVTNADTYRSFALMVTLKNVDWVKGKASNVPEVPNKTTSTTTETTSTKEPTMPKATTSVKESKEPKETNRPEDKKDPKKHQKPGDKEDPKKHQKPGNNKGPKNPNSHKRPRRV